MSTPTNEPPPQRRGGRALRIVLGVLAAVLVVYLLFTVVFPWFQEYTDDPTLDPSSVATLTVAAAR